MEYARSEVVKKWASNLGMYTKEEAQSNVDTQRDVSKEYWESKHKRELNETRERCYNDGVDDGTRMTLNKFSKMSAYAFSKWKLERFNPEKESFCFKTEKSAKMMRDDTAPSEYQPQDSEDEAWEQMMAFQRSNFKDV